MLRSAAVAPLGGFAALLGVVKVKEAIDNGAWDIGWDLVVAVARICGIVSASLLCIWVAGVVAVRVTMRRRGAAWAWAAALTVCSHASAAWIAAALLMPVLGLGALGIDFLEEAGVPLIRSIRLLVILQYAMLVVPALAAGAGFGMVVVIGLRQCRFAPLAPRIGEGGAGEAGGVVGAKSSPT